MNKNTYGNLQDQLVEDIANLQFENAGLRVELERQAVCNGKGSEREAALLGKVEQLARKKAIQGLRLATMADVVLGENAEDRSDETLVREVCRMAREHAALRADKERLDWLAVSDEWFDVPASEPFTPDTFRAAIDAARKEQP